MIENKHKLSPDKWDTLTAEEKKIFNSVLNSFPATQHESALDVAYQGGVKFQFIPT